MKIDFEHSSRRTLLWFAAVINIIGWITIGAVFFAAYSAIESLTHTPGSTQKSEAARG